MTDNFLLHNSAAAEKYWNLQECPSSEESSLMNGCEERLQQLSQRIAGKQNGIRKIEEAIIVLGDFEKRLRRTLSLLPRTEDRKLRENQIYNALSYYLYGDEREAVRYARAAGRKPDGWIARLKHGGKIRKAMVQLRWMFSFIDEKNCRQKLQNRYENEDFCAGLDLLLNVRRSASGAVEYLNRKMFGDYKILKDLKLLKQKAEKALNIYNASQAQKNMAFAGKLSDCEVAALSAMPQFIYSR